jgi:hypothetical protein
MDEKRQSTFRREGLGYSLRVEPQLAADGGLPGSSFDDAWQL